MHVDKATGFVISHTPLITSSVTDYKKNPPIILS